MKNLVFVLALAFSFTAIQSHAQLGGALKKAKEKASGATGTATGTGTFDGTTVQPDACISNVEGRLKSINETYYPKFKADQKGYLASPSALWFARKDMEGAYYYYTGGTRGYKTGGRLCETGPAVADPRYVALKKKIEEAEAKVLEMEKAKGYEFVGVRDGNTIIFKDIKTGKELSADECANL